MPKTQSVSMTELPYHVGAKVRIYPSRAQKLLIKRNSDASRFIYNELVAMHRELFLLRQVKIPILLVLKRIQILRQRLARPAAEISNIHGWLYHVDFDADMKANAIKNFNNAWKLHKQNSRFGIPSFHQMTNTRSYQTSCHYKVAKGTPTMLNGSIRLIDHHYLMIGKLGRIRFAGLPSHISAHAEKIRIGTTTVSMSADGKYYLSFQLASRHPFGMKATIPTHPIGLDLNLTDFLTTSDGEVVANPRFFEQYEHKLRVAQQTLSRQQKHARNNWSQLNSIKSYQYQRKNVARLHQKVVNKRNAFLHKLSTSLVKNHDLIVAEALDIKPMQKKSHHSYAMQDVAWKTFLDMLAYKAEKYGSRFIAVDPQNTTQTCSECQFVMGSFGTKKLPLAVREWDCPRCHKHHLRDQNAAKNVLARGLNLIN